MLNELEKNGIPMTILKTMSYKSILGKSLKNSLGKFNREDLFDEVESIIRFYREIEVLDDVDLDYRIKSFDSCLRKYDKYYPIEIQANTYYDRQINNWLHKFLYKRGYSDLVGRTLRQEYEYGKI